MADFFETEEVVKGYDSVIVRRILSYIKPYPFLTCLLFLALLGTTIGELRIPIIQRQVIDEAILARFIVIHVDSDAALSQDALKAMDELLAGSRGYAIEGWNFIPQGQGSVMSGTVEAELRSRGILQDERWYAFSLEGNDAALALIAAHPGLFLHNDHAAAIKTADLYALPLADIRAIRKGDLDFITRTILRIFCYAVLVFALTFTQTMISSLLGQRVMKDLRLALFKKTTLQSTDFLTRHPVGRIVTRLTGDVETINEFFTDVLVSFLKDLSIMAGVLATIFILSTRMGFVAIATMPPVFLVTAISRIKARNAFRRQRIASSRVNSYLSERLTGVQVVQLFLREKRSVAEFSERNRELLDANLGEMLVFATFRPLIEWLSSITTGAIILVGASMVLRLSLSLGTLITFISLVSMFYHPVMDIAEKYTLLQSAMAGGERVFALLDTDERIPDRGNRSVEGTVSGLIEFQDVHFSYSAVPRSSDSSVMEGYDGEIQQVLKGLTFRI